jgi:glucokinase
MELVAVDLGGTHARFALARRAGDRAWSLSAETVLRAADYQGFEQAWAAFETVTGRSLPPIAVVAVAAPADAETVKLTNNPWVLSRRELRERLGLDELILVNDFAAVAHAVDQLGPAELRHVCGPDRALPEEGVITVVGPGTGLGVAQLLRVRGAAGSRVLATEGGHMDFAPLDATEDALLGRLRARHGRVSVERVVAGAGLAAICEALAEDEGETAAPTDDKALWALALAGEDRLAAAALDRFCMCLGSVAGDLALAHGAQAVVIAGGLGLRLAEQLPRSGFAARFAAKGRFSDRMAGLPVKLVTHPQPGLLGAAAACAALKAWSA